jgi:hypothetical protein
LIPCRFCGEIGINRGWRVNVKRVERIWRQEYNTFRPRSALGYPPPAPEAVQWSIQTAIGLPSTATVGLT